MRHALLALQFLTIIPVRVPGTVTGPDMARAAVWFPLVGGLKGLLIIALAPLLLKAFPTEVAAIGLLLALIVSNAGFHLDGLADSFDALAMKSTGDRRRDIEKRLAVMKDSRTGVAGLISVVMALLIKFEFIKWMILADHRLLFVMPLISQWLMVPVMKYGRPARPEGLGRIFSDHLTNGMVAAATLLLSAILAAFWLLALKESYSVSAAAMLASAVILVSILGLAWVKFCYSKFDGVTGDTTGAVGEFADLALLVILYGWLQWLQPSI